MRFAKRCPLLHCALLRQGRSRLLLPGQVTEPGRPALQAAVLEQPHLRISVSPPGRVQRQRNVGFLGKEGQEAWVTPFFECLQSSSSDTAVYKALPRGSHILLQRQLWKVSVVRDLEK